MVGQSSLCFHFFLTDELYGHLTGSIIPAPNRHALQHLSFHDVTAVLVDVVVRLPLFPETTDRKNKSE